MPKFWAVLLPGIFFTSLSYCFGEALIMACGFNIHKKLQAESHL